MAARSRRVAARARPAGALATLSLAGLALAGLAGPSGCVTPGAADPSLPEARPLSPALSRFGARGPEARCSACTGPLGEAAWTWPDGRIVCERCHQAAVVDPTEAGELLADAQAELERQGLPALASPALRLVDRRTLLADARELAHPALQAFSSIVPGAATPGRAPPRATTIEVLYGLPRVALGGILVHELFHAHQAARRQDPRPVDLAFVEGAAEYVQLRALQRSEPGDEGGEVGEGWAARLVANEDPVYGGGLRRFERLAAAVGEARAIELGLTCGRFPPGY
jgi:hypothetical protein